MATPLKTPDELVASFGGELYTSQFNELKAAANKSYGADSSSIESEFCHAGRWEQLDDDYYDFEPPHGVHQVTTNRIKKTEKRLGSSSGRMAEFLKAVASLLRKWLPVPAAIKAAKGRVLKGKNPMADNVVVPGAGELVWVVTANVKQTSRHSVGWEKRLNVAAKDETAAYKKGWAEIEAAGGYIVSLGVKLAPGQEDPNAVPAASADVLKVVTDALEELIAPHYEKFREGIAETILKSGKDLMARYEHTGFTPEKISRFEGSRPPTSLIVNWKRKSHGDPVLWPSLVENAEAKADEFATAFAMEARARFVAKNVSKVSGIIEAKGNLTDAKVLSASLDSHAGVISGAVKFTFDDGTEFTLKSSVVGKMNQNGTFFYQYPSRFHNVKFLDGSVVSFVPFANVFRNWAKGGVAESFLAITD